ncbi:MAG: hypothetical protein NZM41_02550 [Saprospiraceae bacterium]|nr:hypothetical protein [Saprospiraceae bacterium]
MRSPQVAPALGSGSAMVAYPSLRAGVGQEAALGLGEGSGAWAGATLPYGLSGWQAVRIQAAVQTSKRDGFGLDVAHSGIEAYGEQHLRLMYGRRLSRALLIGGGADVLRVSAREYGQATALTFSLSALANPIPKVWLGAQVYNPIQVEVSGAPIPAVLRLGAAWQASRTFTASAEIEKDLERPAQTRVGMAYHPLSALTLRMGMRAEPLRFTVGADVQLTRELALASAAEWHTALGITPALALVWRRVKTATD